MMMMDNNRKEALDKATFKIYNPSDLSHIGNMPNMKKQDTILAIAAAKKAWKVWNG